MLQCIDHICLDPREPRGPGQRPGARPMSTHAALPLPVSVGRPGQPKPGVSRAAPQGRAQRSLTSPGMLSTRPTEAAISTGTTRG
jgi:hypothetical protein